MGGTLIQGNFQSYAKHPYSAYTGMWGHYVADDLRAESSMRVFPDTFPAGTTFAWDVTPDPDWQSVNGYLAVAFGNYDYNPGAHTPRQVKNIKTLTAATDWTFTGNASSGLLSECWLTATAHPYGGLEDKTHEVAFFPKLSTSSQWFRDNTARVGTFTANRVSWTVHQANDATGQIPYLFAYRTDLKDFRGVLPYKALLKFLTAQGKITGNEWFNGLAFGVEPFTGAGTLTVKKFAVTYA